MTVRPALRRVVVGKAAKPETTTPPLFGANWARTWRLVPSRFPPVSLFERVADPRDIEVAMAIEMRVNPRVRQEIGDVSLVPMAERVSGPGSTPVMAAFCHLNPEGSRFSDGSWGVYYAARSIDTAVAEVAHHRAIFLARTKEPPIEIDLRSYVGHVRAELHDVREGAAWAGVHDPDSYAASSAFARGLRAGGSWGIAYRSVRHAGGECIALFRPKAVSLPVVQGAHVALHWNGTKIDSWYEKSGLNAL